MIYNFIGQPHSGKTTLAKHLRTALEIRKKVGSVYIIDGDKLRELFQNKDYSKNGRRNNISTAYSIARYLQDIHPLNDIIIALVSPFIDLREELKEATEVIEIFVNTTNIRGKEKYHVADFENPIINYININTTDIDELSSVKELIDKIKNK